MKGDVKRNNSPMAGEADSVVVAASPSTVIGNPYSGNPR